MKPLLKKSIYVLCLYLLVYLVSTLPRGNAYRQIRYLSNRLCIALSTKSKYLMPFLLVFSVHAHAAPLYVEHVELATIEQKKLDEAYRQIKEHKEITLKKDLFVPPFHKQNPAHATDKNSFCSTCHLLPPHKENKRKRSFLNMHSQYISCETCHFKPENIQLEYKWLDFNENNNENLTQNSNNKRITPFYNNEAVIIFVDHELATQVKQIWQKESADKELSTEESPTHELSTEVTLEKAKLKLRIHSPLDKKGPKCIDCHNNKDPFLDLASLGFDKKEIFKLQQHSIPRFFGRYTKDGTKDEQRLRMTDLLQ